VSTAEIPKIETRKSPSIDLPEPGSPRAPVSAPGRQGDRRLVAGTARRDRTPFLTNGTAACP
jgi:hypothetical protein